ncbi:hypothetical protein K1T73_14000 [Roseovarius sp. SCSIO 43702]|uniref:hypothetical protein n=1 Tax=Roseovarius sp. SCSIO 43702 TaxID=2823043 RepID=UPI001C738DD2|nr:hypothetical protein [Roseovarius sp. SCSIO 43702]QYX56163.1 hypothetical protein K1T73_14000 [Roseovarius sp. SCSIO 43702]
MDEEDFHAVSLSLFRPWIRSGFFEQVQQYPPVAVLSVEKRRRILDRFGCAVPSHWTPRAHPHITLPEDDLSAGAGNHGLFRIRDRSQMAKGVG